MCIVDLINSGCIGDQFKIGCARAGTKEQSFDLQLDALSKAGCEEI
jgi:hypothetical protein